ncbi:hypothetical protein Tco_1110498 [Tanacetum coccineum]|uniref:Protein TIC 214 n=1 Tax=Tanacetum coccineum TaxID=301880 RepID=A0ABQ5IKE6_9ASTR
MYREGLLGRKRIPISYFFNHDLEYLKYGNKEKMYALSVTKIKASRYEDEGIKEMIPFLWSPKDIINVQSIKVNNKYRYSYMEEIEVKRKDKKLYKFIEADFPNLNQNDIENLFMLKIHNTNGVDEHDLINSLQLFIRRIVIKKSVEDVQLGVESYQTKLNRTKPQLI